MAAVLVKLPTAAIRSLSCANSRAMLVAVLGSPRSSRTSSSILWACFCWLYSFTYSSTALRICWPFSAFSPVSGTNTPILATLSAAVAGAARNAMGAMAAATARVRKIR